MPYLLIALTIAESNIMTSRTPPTARSRKHCAHVRCCKLGIVFALRVLKRPRNSQLSGAEGVLSGIVATSGERSHTKTGRANLDRGTVISM